MTEPKKPINFPTLAKHDPKKVEKAIESLMKNQGADRHNAMVTLEMDLEERELLAKGG